MEKIQVDILGLSTSPASGGAYALILKEINGNRRLPIIIGAFEAQSIALEMEGIKPPRPLTHDLMKNIIDSLGVAVAEVIISELRDGTFYAKLSLEATAVNQEVDSRPSDAIALAVRFGVPIFVSDKVMDEASFLPESEEAVAGKSSPESEKAISPKLSKLEILRNQLKEAVEREEYERASKLRDEIKRIEHGS